LCRDITNFFGVVFKIVLILSLELDNGIEDDLAIVLLKSIPSVLFLKGTNYSSNILIFPEKSLVLTSTLHRTPGADEDGHLLEDFAGSKIKISLPAL
jgi:hypothetical protein